MGVSNLELLDEKTPRVVLFWLLVVLVLTLIVSGAATGYMSVRAALHQGGWLRAGDRVMADAQDITGSTKAIVSVVAKGAGPAMDSINQGGQKIQEAMDSVQGAADQINSDILPSVSYTMQEVVDVTGTANKLLTHATEDLDAAKAKAAVTQEKLDAAIDAVTALGTEGKTTAAAATNFLNSGRVTLDASTTALNSTKKLIDDSDPLMVHLGQISGDGAVYLHKVLNPDKGHLTKMDYVKAGAVTALRIAPPAAQFFYYLDQIQQTPKVVIQNPAPKGKAVGKRP